MVLVSLVPQVQASPPDASSADSLLVGNYTADTEDLLGGMQKASARGQHPEGATSARGATTHSAPPPRACRWCSCRTPPSRLPGEPRCPTAPLSAAWACRQHPTWLQGACMCVSQARWLACWASCWSARPRRATKTAPVQPPPPLRSAACTLCCIERPCLFCGCCALLLCSVCKRARPGRDRPPLRMRLRGANQRAGLVSLNHTYRPHLLLLRGPARRAGAKGRRGPRVMAAAASRRAVARAGQLLQRRGYASNDSRPTTWVFLGPPVRQRLVIVALGGWAACAAGPARHQWCWRARHAGACAEPATRGAERRRRRRRARRPHNCMLDAPPAGRGQGHLCYPGV